jgi:hypothetical protein
LDRSFLLSRPTRLAEHPPAVKGRATIDDMDDDARHVERPADSDELQSRLLEWLQKEGYPLEFATARAFRRAGFRVLRGEYTPPTSDEPAREVDVVASMDLGDEPVQRVEFVVECKWSGDKPWVLFCDGSGMTSAACITQSVGSTLGKALLWKDAGSRELARLGVFATPDEPAFAGRQGFAGSRDVLFDALRSVTGAARKLAEGYDDQPKAGRLPGFGVVTFPVLVVTGRLFEARLDPSGDMALSEVQSSRLHWRGSDTGWAHATVDVVCDGCVDQFARDRAMDASVLLRVMEQSSRELQRCIAAGSLRGLKITRGARGVLGWPKLLRELDKSLGQGRRALPHK